MRLTRQSTYALRALMYCAINDSQLNQVSAISNAYGISEAFLFKLIKPLVENGILTTVRGRRGGIKLARPANEITLLQSIKLTEDSFTLTQSFDSGETEAKPVEIADLNRALRAALKAFFDVLDGYTIADLVANRVAMDDELNLSA